MNTELLMMWAEEAVSGLRDGPQGQVEGLMCAQVYALLAIANELNRMNDRAERVEKLEQQMEVVNEALTRIESAVPSVGRPDREW